MKLPYLIFIFCAFSNVEATESYFHYRGRLYLTSNDTASWTEVQTFCKARMMEMVTFNTDGDVEFFSKQVDSWTWTGYKFNTDYNRWTDFKGNIARFSTSTAKHHIANKCLNVNSVSGKFRFDSDDCVVKFRVACVDQVKETISRIKSYIEDMNQTISHIKSASEESRVFHENITSAVEQFRSNLLQLSKNYSALQNDRIKVESEWKTSKDEVKKSISVTNIKLDHFSKESRVFHENITSAIDEIHSNYLQLTRNYSAFQNDRTNVESEWKTSKDEVKNSVFITNTKLDHLAVLNGIGFLFIFSCLLIVIGIFSYKYSKVSKQLRRLTTTSELDSVL